MAFQPVLELSRLLCGQLDPSARDLNQLPTVLPTHVLRHVEALRCAIKVEITSGLHVARPFPVPVASSKMDSA
jgi:hypothetical protein